MLAVGDKMNANYLQYLVDMYLREDIHNHYRHRHAEQTPRFNVVDWAASNPHIKTLGNITPRGKSDSAGTVATAAVTSYLHRVAPKLMLKATTRMDHSLEDVAKYIEQTIEFVHQLAANRQNTCPFQYDSGTIHFRA